MTDDNQTESWKKNSASARYNLPEFCPICAEKGVASGLKATDVYVGIFPYIHSDFTLVCHTDPTHKFNFCFPFNKNMTFGYTVFDETETAKPTVDRKCPFHGEKLEVVRFYGNLVFKDGTRKVQLRCPVCFYSERAVL
jgi:hypothetical protein